MRGRNQIVFRSVRTLFDVGAVGGLTDGELLERFEGSPGEVAELAFAVLVERHGPMVLRACRKILRDEHAAQDAFQATFLVLARKGGTARRRDTLGPWLHGVACRVAACARSAEARRRRHEQAVASRENKPTADPMPDDFGPAIHEEIDRLPERYRWPIVLCCLEGITREQAALRLGWCVGTVQSRLARGRERLRERLRRRGIAPSVGTVAAALAAETEAAMRAVSRQVSVESTIRYGVNFTAGHAAAGPVPAGVATLITGVFRAMFLQKFRAVAAASAAVAQVGVGISWGQQPDGSDFRVGPASERAEARPGERLDEIERKLDRLISVLEKSQTHADPRTLAGDAALAAERLKGAIERSDWARKMQEKGYLSGSQAQAERVALMEAEQALDRAKIRLAEAERGGALPRVASAAPVKPEAPAAPVAAMAPLAPVAPVGPMVPAPPVVARIREVEPGRLDRMERRLDALERRLDNLEGRSEDGGFRRPKPAASGSGALFKP